MVKYTYDENKLRLYRQDLDYRIPHEILMNKGLLTLDELYDCTFLVLHPEVFAGHFQEVVVDKLLESGFSIAAIEAVSFDLNCAKAIWRYQWNAATVDRMLFFDLKSKSSPTAIIYLRRSAKEHGLPATLSLHELKGSSRFLERIKPHQFRSVLPFTNRAMTFIHCPDEPVDFLRELSILCPEARWSSVVQQIKFQDIGREAAIHSLRSLCDDECFKDFEFREEKYVNLWNSYLSVSTRESARKTYQSLSFGERWRALTSASNYIQHDLDNEKPIITTRNMPEVVEAWRSMEWK